jgi:hypothetical protein
MPKLGKPSQGPRHLGSPKIQKDLNGLGPSLPGILKTRKYQCLGDPVTPASENPGLTTA